MQHPTDFDLAPSTGTEDQEMTRLMDTPNGFVNAAATVPQMIRPTTGDQTFAGSATSPFGIFGNVLNCLDQQGFVSQPRLLTKVFVGPGEDRHNILRGSRGEYETCHGD
jgi:hypothetical protein